MIDWPTAFEQHRRWLRKVLRCRVGDAHAVEDLLQEVFMVVLKQLDKSRRRENNGKQCADESSTLPQDSDKVAPWLYRVAIRHAVNFHRKQNRLSYARPVAEVEKRSPQPSPLDWILNRESGEHLKSALEQLSGAQREILMLKFSENWSYQQLAQHLGVSVRSVEHRLLKARTQLRSILVASDGGLNHRPVTQEASDATR